jgi:hypothetical protein
LVQALVRFQTVFATIKKIYYNPEVADLYKTENTDDIENNYALVAEEHYYSVSFTFDGTYLKKIVKITDAVELKKQQEEIED